MTSKSYSTVALRIPSDCVPTSVTEVVCELLGGPNKDGDYYFFLYWLTDYVPGVGRPDETTELTTALGLFVRAQIFVSSPELYRTSYIAKGCTYRFVDHSDKQSREDRWRYGH